MNNQTLLTIILMVVIFGAGFLLGRMTSSQDVTLTGSDSTNVSGQQDSAADTVTGGDTTIDSSNMTDGQRKLISSLGLDPNNVTVTAEMIACAEAKLGVARIEEIKNGSTPSFTEGVSLAVCYK